MSSFPPALLVEGRRLPGTAETFKRLVRALDVQPGERVLLVGAGEGAVLKALAREAGAQVTALEWDAKLVAACEARVRDESLSGRVTVRQGDPLTLPAQSFEVVLFETLPPAGELTPYASKVRDLLATNGRLGMTLPVAVGLATPAAVGSHWTAQLGRPLVRPAALLGQLERAGFEPQWAETFSDDVMAEYYRRLEDALGSADKALADASRAAIELFRSGPGRAGASYAMLVARRREPGEKPPPARTAG